MLQSLSNAFGFQFEHGIFAMLLLVAIYLSSSSAMVFLLSTTFTIEPNNSNTEKPHYTRCTNTQHQNEQKNLQQDVQGRIIM